MSKLSESRPTNLIGLVGEITKIPSIERRVDVWSTSDGVVGLFRAVDGNAYEITIRPAESAKHPAVLKKVGK